MSDAVMVAIISGLFLVITALITAIAPKLWRQSRDIAEVKHQVKNSHGTNLRDDLDALRMEVRAGFHQVHVRMHRLENKDG